MELTLILVNLASIMEQADESLLPAVYKEVGATLHADPTALGSLTLFRSIVQSACYPLAAYLSIRHNRAHVIAFGAFLWAAATFLTAFSNTFIQMAVSRGFNGIGLAIVVPAIQSLIADSTEDSNRGLAFGWYSFTGSVGLVLGRLCGILLASTSFMGIDGWRIAFHLVGLVSVVVGLLVAYFAKDPRFDEENIPRHQTRNLSFCDDVKNMVEEAKYVLKIPSFQIFLAQGVSGSFPWSALSFATLWLELMGFSNKKTAALMLVYTVNCSIGGLIGGKMGDVLGERFPNAGRIILSQISSAIAIPLAAILFLGLPVDPSAGFSHGLVLCIVGLTISWNGPGTNNPIFAEIVPVRSRTSIYALDRSFESILSSFAAPVVGLLAQHIYGYKPVPSASSIPSETEKDRANAASLGKALFTAISIPFAICCLIYSFLYKTYPGDRDRARMLAMAESDIEDSERLNLGSKEDQCSRNTERKPKGLLKNNTEDIANSSFDAENGNEKPLLR